MEIQSVCSGTIAIYIESSELAQYAPDPEQVNARDAEGILSAALSAIGRSYSGAANLELYPGRGCLMLFARLCSDTPVYYIFDSLESLIAAAQACPPGIVSSAVYMDGTYFLTVYPWYNEKPPAVLAEFGTPFKAPAAYACHLAEHGTTIATPNAIDIFQTAF
jgi:hypothetical protein